MQLAAREHDIGCIHGCKCPPDPRHVISGRCKAAGEEVTEEYLRTLESDIKRCLQVIPQIQITRETPPNRYCKCRLHLLRARRTVANWRENKPETDSQWHEIIQLITACLPRCTVIEEAEHMSTEPKRITSALTRHIVQLQQTIIDMILTRQRLTKQARADRRDMIVEEWTEEKNRRQAEAQDIKLCARIALRIRREKRELPIATYVPHVRDVDPAESDEGSDEDNLHEVTQQQKVYCPDCDTQVTLQTAAWHSDILTCTHCKDDLHPQDDEIHMCTTCGDTWCEGCRYALPNDPITDNAPIVSASSLIAHSVHTAGILMRYTWLLVRGKRD